jgi:NAD(P)H-binding
MSKRILGTSAITQQSVLIIGATGRTGVECIRHMSQHPSCPEIHAFCQNPSNLTPSDWDLCTSVIEGSARHAIDIEEALHLTKANWVILCVGSGDDVSPNNVRTFTAENLMRVLQKPTFDNIRVIVVSMARSSHSIGLVNKCRLRYILADHLGQERACRAIGHRATIVQSTLFQNIWDDRVIRDDTIRSKHHRSPSLSSASSQSSSSSSATSIGTISSSPTRSLKRSSIFRGSSKIKANSYHNQHLTRIGVLDDNETFPTCQKTSRSDLGQWITQHICECDSNETSVRTSDPYSRDLSQDLPRIVKVASFQTTAST